MTNQDLQTLESIKNSLASPATQAVVRAAEIDNPAVEVEKALVTFLKHQLIKLQDNTSYETQVKDTIMTRLSEATFPQLVALLEVMQKNNNDAMQKVLAPFIAQNSDKTLLDSTRESSRQREAGDVVYSETEDKNVLQGMQALSQFLLLVQEQQARSLEDSESTGEESAE